jgi:hypothetical protein
MLGQNSYILEKNPIKSPAGIDYKSFNCIHDKVAGMAKSSSGDYDIPDTVPIYDQLSLGACVSHGVCETTNIILSLQNNPTMFLSRLFLYYLCREPYGTIQEDTGTSVWFAINRIANIGICLEDQWPYDVSKFTLRPPPECYVAASSNTITSWYQIDSTGKTRCDQIEASVRSNHPVVFATACGDAMQTYRAGQILNPPTSSEIKGYHCIVVTGVRYINGQRVFRVRNSWGPAYGDNGHLLMSESYFQKSYTNDLWFLSVSPALVF